MPVKDNSFSSGIGHPYAQHKRRAAEPTCSVNAARPNWSNGYKPAKTQIRKRMDEKMAENQNGKFRPKKINFAPVSNSALKDPRLTLKAKGLYALIQSYITMPNFLLNKGWLRDRCREGEKAFDSAWKELKDCGFLKQYRIPNGKNDTFRYEYELLDEADESRPALITLNKHGERIPAKHPENGSISHTPQNGG